MNESGSEPRIGQVSYLAMAQGSEKSGLERYLKNFFSKKSRKKLHSKNKSLTFVSAFASKRKAKFFERFQINKQNVVQASHIILMGDEKKINRQFKNNFNGILNRDKTISFMDIQDILQ